MIDSNEIRDFLEKKGSKISVIITNIDEVNEELENENKGLNAFELVSDYYYRETFHTHIIAELLKYEQDSKKVLLELFIKLLNSNIKEVNKKINLENFQQAVIEEGKDYIDILIRDKKSKQAIIIENKINKAVDQDRQLPGYIDSVNDINKETIKYTPVKIVYLTKHGIKTPAREGYDQKDIKNVEKLFLNIPSYNNTKNDLYSGWLSNAINDKVIDNDDNIKCILKQYKSIIYKIGENAMNNEEFRKFYKILKENNNSQIVSDIIRLEKELPQFMAIQLNENIGNDIEPFNRQFLGPNDSPYYIEFRIDINQILLAFNIDCSIEGYNIILKDHESKDKNGLKNIISKLDLLDKFEITDDNRFKFIPKFKLSQEDEVIKFFKVFKSKLKNLNNV